MLLRAHARQTVLQADDGHSRARIRSIRRAGRGRCTDMAHEKFQNCIDACNDCVVACEHCATACLQEEDVKMMARCVELDRACATICAAAVRLMASGSEFALRRVRGDLPGLRR